MLKTLGIVQACFSTPRFHGLACRQLGGQSLLAWVIRRVTDYQQLDGVIVLASAGPDELPVRDLVPSDVPLLLSDRPDAMGRFLRALEEARNPQAVDAPNSNSNPDPPLASGNELTPTIRPLIRPARRQSASVFKVWLILYALVGAQMGWVLRPFIGFAGHAIYPVPGA